MSMKTFFSLLLILFVSFSASAEWTRIIGDIEGIPKRWQQLASEGVVSFDSKGQILLNDGYSLSFEGDLMKRGPYGKRTIELISDLINRYNVDLKNPRVRVVLGNHDLNTISLIQWLPMMASGTATDFNQWLVDNKRSNDQLSRVEYWLQYNGVNDKLEWFWLELVAEKLGKSSLDPSIKTRFYPDGKPLTANLATQISKEQAISQFLDFVRPGGVLWNLYGRSKIIDLYETKDGVRFLNFHSGILTTGNFGVVPGEGQNMFERAIREYYAAENADRILKTYDFNKIEDLERFEQGVPGFTLNAVQLWVKRYNEFITLEMSEVERLYNKLSVSLKIQNGKTIDASTLSLANQLYSNRLAALADAGWDPVTGKLMVEANSLVYPDSRVAKGSSIPGLPEDFIVKVLALAKIDFITGGHQPVGDGMIHRTAHAYDRVVQFLLTDTSFSPIEQEDFLRVRDDGYLQFKTKNRNGTTIVIERPGHDEEAKLKAMIDRYNSLSSDSISKITPEAKVAFEERVKRFNANQKLGLLANGWLIVGFGEKQNAKGQTVPDYDNFILFQKQGRNMVYKTVDIWGITSPDVKLEFAKTDLSEMATSANKEKIDDLKKHGKDVLNILRFERTIRGKNVLVISGPALNSLTKALKSDDAKKIFEDYKIQFKNWLEALPPNESWVFIGGGTQGFEAELNKIISEVSQKRQNPFEMIGVVAGVTGGAELDHSVSKYLPLSKAFYWDDYFTELLPLLSRPVRAKAAKIQFLFGGGGAIVGKQIREVLSEIDHGFKVEVSLLPGLSMGMTNSKDMSATDQFIQSELGMSVIGTKMSLVKRSTDAIGKQNLSINLPIRIIETVRQAGSLKPGPRNKCSEILLKYIFRK
jgi:hypothetical protein